MSTVSAPCTSRTSHDPGRERECPGGAWFVPAANVTDAAARLLAARFLVVPATDLAPEPGSLAQAIDDAVEGALAMRGALPPAVEVDADLARSIRDRLLRVRALDRAGLAIAMPRLGRLVDAEGALDRTDSSALVAWISAARTAPIVLVLDERDRRVRALAPMAIEEVAPEIEPILGIREPAHGDETERPPEVELVGLTEEEPPASEDEDPTLGLDAPTPVFQIAVESFPEARAPEPPPPAEPEPPPRIETPSARRAAERVVSAAEWRSYAVELDAARGPKPARMIDKLFVTRYVPLLGAVARGEVDTAVKGVVEAWRTSFEHSYREGFPALRVTGKRPPMVFDAPDIAAKIGRLGGARSVKLLLVDSMSFDLGERVTARLAERLAGKALCVERQLLWSALPTTTPTQIALLGRGPDGLRDPLPTSEREPDVARGRALTTLRRERIGSRELMKLDVVEARLRTAGPAYDDRLDLCAEEVTQIVARYAEGLAARTLLFVFGDHGFRMPITLDGRSTGPATQGGSSPEEVLVPGYAWLVGGVH